MVTTPSTDDDTVYNNCTYVTYSNMSFTIDSNIIKNNSVFSCTLHYPFQCNTFYEPLHFPDADLEPISNDSLLLSLFFIVVSLKWHLLTH